MSVRIYKYGLPFGPAKKDRVAVDQQMSRARAYQNQLIAVEKARRGAYRMLRRKHAPGIAALEDEKKRIAVELEDLRVAIKAANAKSRSRKTTTEQREKAKTLKARRKEINAQLKQLRKDFKANASAHDDLKLCDERANDMVKRLRAACGVYWGTYLLIEQAVQQASKKADPVHRTWRGDGRVGVQFQGGLPVVAAFGDDTRLQIDPVPDAAFTGSRGTRRRLSRTTCRIRIGSDNRQPIWAEFPLVLHRPLPKDGIIKWAWVHRQKIVDGYSVGSGRSRSRKGDRYRWTLQLVVDSESFDQRPTVGNGTCAIDIGWRLREAEGGLRVGYLVDEQDNERELLLPSAITGKLAHADTLRSQDDQNYDAFRAQLATWLQSTIVPAWLKQRLAHMHKWRSKKPMASIVHRWDTHRFDGDDQMFAVAKAWLKQHRHLYEWECHSRTKALGHRREHYRLLATEICRRYDTVVLEDIDLTEIARRADAEEKETLHETARLQRTRASLSDFRAALTLAASNNGTTIVLVPAPHTTTSCWVCGHDCSKDKEWDPAANLHHTCSACKTTWDQDNNAARNMLAAHHHAAAA